MRVHADAMHEWWCKEGSRMDTALCDFWFSRSGEREEALRTGSPLPRPEKHEMPAREEIDSMHREWCALEGNDSKEPCKMFNRGARKTSEL